MGGPSNEELCITWTGKNYEEDFFCKQKGQMYFPPSRENVTNQFKLDCSCFFII